MSFVDSVGSGKFCNVNVSYTVVGYHPDASTDPLHAPFVASQTKYDRLAVLDLQPMNNSTRADLDQNDTMRAFSYGSVYNIAWERALADQTDGHLLPPSWQHDRIVFPADDVQNEFIQSHPVSIGTNALDSLFGWLRTIPDDVSNGLPPQDVVPAELIKKNIFKLRTLLLDLNDDLDAQLEAEDLLAMNNFIPSPQGTLWHLQIAEDDSKNTAPSTQTIEALRALNENQTRINAFIRRNKRLQTQLFNVWWTYTCDRHNGDSNAQQTRRQGASQEANGLKEQLLVNANTVPQIQTLIDGAIASPALQNQLKQGAELPFFRQRDPTLFIAGLRSVWPAETDTIPVRSITNTKATSGSHNPASVCNWNFGNRLQSSKLPADVFQGVGGIFQESCINWTDDLSTVDKDIYYKNGDRFTGSNGWFPLFMEWEVEYYHIPFENWQFDQQTSSGVVAYHLKDSAQITTDAIKGDLRVINGRCPVLPQASSILATTLQQAFDRIGAANLPISLDQQDQIIQNALKLDTVSTPLDSFTNQLITLMQGTHITPVVQGPNGAPQFTDDGAAQVSSELSLTPQDLALDAAQLNTTPFAGLVNIPADSNTYSPFKPCTHGQFRFTKLNIVDKFGQIVQGIKDTCDPEQGVGLTQMPLFPCLGEAYSLDTTSTNIAKTVIPRSDGLCEFVQLPPSINQNARINADFLVDQMTGGVPASVLKAAGDWDNPVRGWLVLNYANASMQVSLSDVAKVDH